MKPTKIKFEVIIESPHASKDTTEEECANWLKYILDTMFILINRHKQLDGTDKVQSVKAQFMEIL